VLERRLVPAVLAFVCAALPPGALAQTPAEDPPAGQDEALEEVPAGIPLREAYEETLEATIVHFEFRRAPLEDIAVALERASGVQVQIGEGATKLLRKRKFKIRYVADRTGLQVLEDLAKAAALDFEITDEGAILDEAKTLAALRAELGLEPRRLALEPREVAAMLEDKRLSIVARERSLAAVIAFLRRQTGIRFVRLQAEAAEPQITARITDEPLGVVLTKLLEPLEMSWLQRGTVVVIGSRETIEAQRR
jgi:hypothetical protein